MASNIKFKRSAVQNRVPTTAQLALGELALNTYDGKLYTEINTGSATVIEIGSKLSSLVVDGDNGAGGGDVTFHGTTAGRDLTWDYSDDSLKLADNTKIKVGNGGDFFIGHDPTLFGGVYTELVSTNGNILLENRDTGANKYLYLKADAINMRSYTGNEAYITCQKDSDVKLYFNNSERITTTVDGADISGTGSLKVPVGTTAQRNSSPTDGDLRYNTTTGGFEGYSNNNWGEIGAGGVGIGSDASNPRTGIIQNRVGVGFTDLNIVGAGISVTGYGTTVFVDFNEFKPGSFHRTIHNYTATAGQTTFAGLNYEVSEKQIAVYLNGARLSEATYTATSGTTVVLDVGASVGDEVEIINIHTNSDVDRKVNTYTATAGQTTFTGLSYNSKTELDVYLNGIRLASDDFTATSGSTVVLAVGASVNDIIDIVSTGDGVTWRSTTDASGDVYKLTNVGIGTDQTPDKLNVRGNSSFVGVTTFTGNVDVTQTLHFPDVGGSISGANAPVAKFGNSSDLIIGHDGSDSRIRAAGAGQLILSTANGFRVQNSANNHGIITGTPNGSVSLFHANSRKFETTSTGASITGNLNVSGVLTYDDVTNVDSVGIVTARDHINIVTDNKKLQIGAGQDLQLYHDGTNSRIHNTATGNLIIRNEVQDADVSIQGNDGGSNTVMLAFDTSESGNAVFSGNIKLTDGKFVQLGQSNDLSLTHTFINNSHNGVINNATNTLFIESDSITIRDKSGEGGEVYAQMVKDGAVSLRHNNNLKFATTAYGIDVTGTTGTDGLAVSGISTFSNDLLITNNSPVLRLTESDTSTVSRLVMAAGQLYIQAGASGGGASTGNGNIYLTGYNAQETYAIFNGNGAVQLYHNNIKKFDTTTSGINVTGTTDTDNLYVSGAATIKASALDTDFFSVIRQDHSSTKLLRIFQDSSSGGGAGGCHINTNNRHLMITANTSAGSDDGIYLKTSGEVGIGTDNPNQELTIYGDEPNIRLTHTGSTNKFNALYTHVDGTGVEWNSYQDGTGTRRPFIFKQYTTEVLRIDSSGRVLIGTTTEGSTSGDDLTIATSGTTGITLRSGTSNNGNILFSDGTSGSSESRGVVQYAHSDNSMRLFTNASERLRISSTGYVNIGPAAAPRKPLDITGPDGRSGASSGNSDTALLIDNDGGNGAIIEMMADNNAYGRIFFTDTDAHNRGQIVYEHANDAFMFATAGSERLRIASDGDVSIGGVTPARGPLHVHENSSGDCQIHLTNNDTGSSSSDGLTIYTDTDTSGIWSREAVDFQIATSSTERVRIHADGRMNIGGTNEVQLTASNQAILYLHGAVVGADLDGMFGLRTVMDDDDTGTTTADRERGSAYFQFNGNCSGGDTSDETRLWNIWSDVNATADYDNCYGFYGDVRTTHTSGTISHMRGAYGIVQTASSGTVTEMVGMYGIAQPTTGSSGTVADVVGGKFRANMSAGSSTVKATDLFGVWSQIDNDNNVNQSSSGTRTALFYGNYDKTTGLNDPQGIRIDSAVPNYFRGGIALNGGSNFLPTGNHAIHIKDNTNATGIFLEQTGDQYNVIRGMANRSGTGNAIIDLQGYWNSTQVARIRLDTGVDTTNKDDGEIQFFTSSANNISEKMTIQPNGEIAMDSAGTPTDALANLHVQNSSFRVSNPSDGPTSTYVSVITHPNGTDGDRHIYSQVTGGTIKAAIDHSGRMMSHSHHYAGRTRTDANSPTNIYTHANAGFFAYSARTDNSAAYRTSCHIRAWDSGDSADRNAIYLVDSQSDTTTADYDQHQRFGVKADGMTHSREDIWAGRIESDEGSPNSVYTANNTNLVRCYANNSNAQSYMQGVATPATNIYTFYTEHGTSNDNDNVVFRVRSTDGRVQTDAGSVQTGGADYAEFFEWEDGNPSNEDRVGISVVLVGEKIRPATSSDDTSKIIGIISATPCVVGDTAALSYHDRYLKDDWGRYVMEDVEMLVWNHGQNEYQPKQSDSFALTKCDECIPVSDIDKALAEGRVKQWAVDQNLRRMDQVLKVNPNYDINKKDDYEPREDRKEWDAVGLVGKLYMKKGQPTGTNWIKLSDKTASIERWLVR